MEEINPPPPTDSMDNYTELALRMLRLKRRLKLILPEHKARLRQQLDDISPRGGPGSPRDYASVLVIVARRATPLTMGELSAELGVPLSTATRIVDWLVQYDYIQREPDPEDRRIIRVSMTEAGQRQYQTISTHIRQKIGQLLVDFSPEEQIQFVQLIHKLLDALEREV